MKKYLLFLIATSALFGLDEVDTPLRAQYRELQATNCYCNNPAGTTLINSSLIKPSEKKINEEISQMIVDARNEVYYIREFWTRGLGAEASQFATQRAMYQYFNFEETKQHHEFEKKNRYKCVALDLEINAISTQIADAELALLKLKESK